MSLSQPAILLLIPDARLRDIYISRFERAGWEVEAATHLADAERRAVHLRPEVLLVHRAMLEDIKTTLKRFRSLPSLRQTRFVVTDKHLSSQAIDEAYLAGAHEVVLTAHLTLQALIRHMNQLID